MYFQIREMSIFSATLSDFFIQKAHFLGTTQADKRFFS